MWRAKARKGIIWPCAMNGKSTMFSSLSAIALTVYLAWSRVLLKQNMGVVAKGPKGFLTSKVKGSRVEIE